jgi:hypothetical protein
MQLSNLSHMPFRFPTDFMFLTPGPCESLGRLRRLTMKLEQISLPCPSSIFTSIVLTGVATLREETGAGHGVGEVKETSTITKTD